MAVTHVNVIGSCKLPLGLCSEVYLCLIDEWASRTVSGKALALGKVINITKVVLPAVESACSSPCEPCDKFACQYHIQIELDQFLEDPETEEPFTPTVDDVTGLFPFPCILDKIPTVVCISEDAGNIAELDELGCIFVPTPDPVCISEDEGNIAELDELGCIFVPPTSITSSPTQLIVNNGGVVEGTQYLLEYRDIPGAVNGIIAGDILGSGTALVRAMLSGLTYTELVASVADSSNLIAGVLGSVSTFNIGVSSSLVPGHFFLQTAAGRDQVFILGATERLRIDATTGDATFANNVHVPLETYGASWSGSDEVPTKKDIYDYLQAAWPTWVPTFSAGGAMTYTGVGGVIAKYKILGSVCHLMVSGSGTTGGVADGDLIMSLPVGITPHPTNDAQPLGRGVDGSMTPVEFILIGTDIHIRKVPFGNWGLGAARSFAGSLTLEIT